MKNTLFETRQRAEDLLKETVAIWRQSDQSDSLEGIEEDPVFSLLMMALAYLGNEADSELERLKEEVLDDFARLLTPYELAHAVPATMAVSTVLQAGVAEQTLTSDSLFTLKATYPFIPLCQTRVLNAQVASVTRIDGRRWKVRLNFGFPVTDLSGFAFAITNLKFRDVNITVDRQPLPLIKPWNYAELPFTPCFSPSSMVYNRAQVYNPSLLPLDLFARQNVRMFIVDKHKSQVVIPMETEVVDMVFEFSGITDKFPFDKSHLALNTTLLVNAMQHEATLTSKMPIARLAGYDDDATAKDVTSRQFMHLLQPLDAQIFAQTEVEVRRAVADRFNQGSLVKLLNCIVNKYHSDFYAFLNIRELTTDKLIYNLDEILSKMLNASVANPLQNVPGVYLLLRRRSQMYDKNFSLSLKYLTTAGAAINSSLSQEAVITPPPGFEPEVVQIAAPVPGVDEMGENSTQSLLRYYMLTSDRIVTPADIKVFCHKELMLRYGITQSMVKQIHVSHRLTGNYHDGGYEIIVTITLADNSFIRRKFIDNLSVAEILLEKMIEVRSTNIYPVTVMIAIEE